MKLFSLKFTGLLFILFSTVTMTSQTLLRATVLDKQTKEPVTNARFGISNQGIGVITNSEGKFTYRKYHQVLDETSQFQISAPGYLGLTGSVDVLRKLQNKLGVIYLEKNSEKPIAPDAFGKIVVLWDASAKSASRDPASEIAYLKEYLTSSQTTEISVVIFNETIVAQQAFKVSATTVAMIEDILSNVEYKGVSDYGLLDEYQVDEMLLFAENKPTFGTFQPGQKVPVHVLNSSLYTTTDAYFESLCQYTSGSYKKLNTPRVRSVVVEDGPTITGTYVNGTEPVPYAIISKTGVLKEYFTDAEGNFKVPATEGDKLTFYSLGNYPKTLTITSETNYTVIAVPKAEQLAEVNLKAKKKRSEYAFDSIYQLDVVQGRTVPVRSIYKSQFNKNAFNLAEAIDGIYGAKVVYIPRLNKHVVTAKGTCARVFIDDVEGSLDDIPMSLVENVSIYHAYGSVGECPARIIVTTRMHPDRIDQRLRKRGYEQLENNFYKENVETLDTKSLENPYFSKSAITGTVRGNGTLLQGVSILRRGSLDEVFTNADGVFAIEAAEGDILEIKHFGMYSKSVVITDSKEYSIDMITKAEILDEVAISSKTENPATENIAFNKDSRMEVVNGRKYDVRSVLYKEDLNMAGLDIFETVKMSSGSIKVDANIASSGKVFEYERGGLRIPLTAVVDGVETDPTNINPLVVERISIYIAPLRSDSKIFITTRNHPDFLEKRRAENDITLKNNIYEEEVANLKNNENQYFTPREITGKVLVKNTPLQGASILKRGTLQEVIAHVDGVFSIKAAEGDILEIKHPGMYPKTLVITGEKDYTIQLINKTETLKEVSVTSQTETEEEKITTAYGEKNKNAVGYQVQDQLSKYISPADATFDQVAKKIPGVMIDPVLKQYIFNRSKGAINRSPIMIIVDGTVVTQSALPIIDPQIITNITALKGLAATNKYGSQAFGGVLLISTLNSSFKDAEAKPDIKLKNNIYNETLPTLSFDAINEEYIDDVATKLSTKIKLEKYRTIKNRYLDKVDFYVDMALYFQQIDAGAAREIRNDFMLLAKDNVKALRILAYLNEHAGEFMQAQKVYERVLEMDPGNPQSYRDLALVYQETGEYNKALELYVNMLGNQVPGVNFSSLTSVLSNELQRLINLHKHKINYQRLSNDWLAVNFNIDVRMTASWSDTNAPFEFQFVNPENRFYNWNSDRTLNKEINKDTATEEFVIDNADPGNWLINVRYIGDVNATNIPPYLKYTLYKDFGTTKETKTIKLVKLESQIQKVTLDSFVY